MRISGPSVTSGVLEGFGLFLEARGVRLADVITAAALPYSELACDYRNEIPLVDLMDILHEAARLSHSPCLGCEWGEVFPVGATGVYGYLLSNSRTLGDAMRVTARYLPLVVHPVAIGFDTNRTSAILSWYLSPNLQTHATQYILFAASATVARLRGIAGGNWEPEAVEISCPEPPCRSIVSRVLGPSTLFGCLQTRIVASAGDLGLVNAQADARLFGLMSDFGDRMLKEREQDTKVSQLTRRAISGRLGTNDVSLEAIAAILKISPRKLQSRLAAEGTSFETVLQLTKQRYAEHYLRETNYPLTEIAQRLGFSELSAFTRASLRWFHKPPSALRLELKPLPAAEDESSKIRDERS